MRAIVHQGLGNPKQSIADWTRSIELASDDGTKMTMYRYRSNVYESMGDRLSMANDRVEAMKIEIKLEERR